MHIFSNMKGNTAESLVQLNSQIHTVTAKNIFLSSHLQTIY